ncbi:MAG TPA: FAD-dependent oxidoreductase [bacterium]|nr:FAD-dependent oxidoreductase [bacterium]
MPTSSKVLVVGGGIVGSACAYYLTLAEADVTLIERKDIAAEASGASQGFVDWASGLSRDTLNFVYESIQLLKTAARDLDDFTLTLDGYLMVAVNDGEIAGLRRRYDRAREAHLDVQWLEGAVVRTFEPALSRDVVAGLYMPDSGHVNPKRMTLAFARAAERRGAQLVPGVEIIRLETRGGRVVGAASTDRVYAADHVVLAAGAWSPKLAAPLGINLPIEPGKGQILATHPLPPITTRVINSSGAGVCQDRAGAVLVGSTLEFVGFDKNVSDLAGRELLSDAARIVPALQEARIQRMWAGLRPMTPDQMSMIGEAPGVRNLWLAAGHSRTGLSYAPGTGRAIADLVMRGNTTLPIQHFRVDRFARQ